MRIQVLKKLLWTVNTILVLGCLAFAGTSFVAGHRPHPRTAEAILHISGRPQAPPAVPNEGPGPEMTYQVVADLPIDGMPPVKPVDTSGAKTQVKNVPALEKAYDLEWVYVDHRNPFHSIAELQPKGKKTILDVEVGKRVDDTWKLVHVTYLHGGQATFRKEGSDDKVVLQQTTKAIPDTKLVIVTKPGQPIPGRSTIPAQIGVEPKTVASSKRPEQEAIEVSKNHWRVPRKEYDWWSENGERVSKDVSLEPVTDPRTGSPQGVMIKSVSSGSILADRGIDVGDIVKSINGHPVNSRADAIEYFKGPGKDKTSFNVVVERKNGKIVTLTYSLNEVTH